MSNYNKIFHKVPIEVQNRSGFNKSHQNTFTAKVGTLMPVLVDEVLPNTKVRLNLGAEIQLPPMATDFYGRVRGKYEAFFVPFRLLYGGWQELITHQDDGSGYPENTENGQKAKYLPSLELPRSVVKSGSLSDMLGLKELALYGGSTIDVFNPLPFLAYHKIWDDWYRDSRIQKSAFSRQYSVGNVSEGVEYFYKLPYVTRYGDAPLRLSGEVQLSCADGLPCYVLRQRNWQRDYFTNATTAPQMGSVSKIVFRTDGETGEFTMPQLFAANALQKWAQVNNLAGNRYADQIKAHFGVLPSDAILDRTIYLGSKTVDVYNKSVYSTSTIEGTGSNPFESVGTKFGNSIGVQPLNGDMLIHDFTATEHGFIFVMFSLVPDAVYSTGTRKYMSKNKMSDFAFPSLSHMGDQEIGLYELVGGSGRETQATFGYTQRYSEYKFMIDEVHGLLRDGESLEAFALQRSFDDDNRPNLGSAFLEIPTDYLDQVTAVSGNMSRYGCWCVTHFDYKIATPLPAYSIPTLGDLKDTHTEVIDNGGRRL